MTSLVLDLQKDALNENTKISTLLRKSFLVSKKLKIKDIEDWIYNELHGYKNTPIPEYRIVTGELKALNYYTNTWIQMAIPDQWNSLCQKKIPLSVSQLEELQREDGSNFLQMNFSQDICDRLMKAYNIDFRIALLVPSHHLVRILDAIRTEILQFALNLEEKGIMGNGMRFSSEDQQLAKNITYNTINIHRMENSQIQQDADKSGQII